LRRNLLRNRLHRPGKSEQHAGIDAEQHPDNHQDDHAESAADEAAATAAHAASVFNVGALPFCAHAGPRRSVRERA